MDLSDIVGMGKHNAPAQPEGKMDAQPAAAAPGGSSIQQLMKTMPADGVKKTAAVVVAISAKLLQQVVLAYGDDSKEGAKVKKAIADLSPITKNVQTGDMESVIKSIIQTLPPNMRNLQPGSANEILQAITGTGTPPAPAAGAQPPVSALQQGGGGSPLPISKAI